MHLNGGWLGQAPDVTCGVGVCAQRRVIPTDVQGPVPESLAENTAREGREALEASIRPWAVHRAAASADSTAQKGHAASYQAAQASCAALTARPCPLVTVSHTVHVTAVALPQCAASQRVQPRHVLLLLHASLARLSAH